MLIVGLDGSARSTLVLAAARMMAERLGDRLYLVSALEGWELHAAVPPELSAWSDATLWAENEQRLRTTLEQATAALPSGLLAGSELTQGQPWRVICEASAKRGGTMIVIGAHGYHDLERMLGTTAAHVAAKADTSVLVVRQAPGASAPVGFERVLAAHHGTQGVLDMAVSLAQPSWGRLTLLRAVRPPRFGGHSHDAALVEAARLELSQLRATLPDQLPSEIEVRVGRASEVIVDVAKDKDATLIVMGHGANATRVVNHADRSVLVVR